LLNQARSSSIEAELDKIRLNWINGRWLLPQNRYNRNCIKRIRNEKKYCRPFTHRHLREYIAASSLAHCMDGWTYLGRSIEAHLKGDPDVARHLGYYAELRASMSLLASEGIGVFDRIHFIVNGRMKCKRLVNESTHEFAWDALEHWAETASAAQLIFRLIQPGGLPLAEWLNYFATTPAIHQLLAKEWLFQWGLDLKRLRNDREARNSSSYRPTAFSDPRAINIGDALKFVKSFWEICEPIGSIRFPLLDRHILRHSLDFIFRNANMLSRKRAKRRYERQVNMMLYGLAPGELTVEKWADFLNYKNSPESHIILKEAGGKDKPASRRHHIQVLARAILLLRLATGAVYIRLKALQDFNKSDLEFWWAMLGEDRCLWDTGNPPYRFVDLWTDIREALQKIDAWQEEHHADGISYNKLWQEQTAAGVLGTCERVCLWGLGL
jgi:hypothetical protein